MGVKGQRSTKNRRRVGALIAGVLLILAVSLCAFHGSSSESHDHGMFPDLCAIVILILVTPVLLPKLVVEGWVVSISRGFFSPVAPALLYRPPESFSLLVIPGSSYRVCTGGLI